MAPNKSSPSPSPSPALSNQATTGRTRAPNYTPQFGHGSEDEDSWGTDPESESVPEAQAFDDGFRARMRRRQATIDHPSHPSRPSPFRHPYPDHSSMSFDGAGGQTVPYNNYMRRPPPASSYHHQIPVHPHPLPEGFVPHRQPPLGYAPSLHQDPYGPPPPMMPYPLGPHQDPYGPRPPVMPYPLNSDQDPYGPPPRSRADAAHYEAQRLERERKKLERERRKQQQEKEEQRRYEEEEEKRHAAEREKQRRAKLRRAKQAEKAAKEREEITREIERKVRDEMERKLQSNLQYAGKTYGGGGGGGGGMAGLRHSMTGLSIGNDLRDYGYSPGYTPRMDVEQVVAGVLDRMQRQRQLGGPYDQGLSPNRMLDVHPSDHDLIRDILMEQRQLRGMVEDIYRDRSSYDGDSSERLPISALRPPSSMHSGRHRRANTEPDLESHVTASSRWSAQSAPYRNGQGMELLANEPAARRIRSGKQPRGPDLRDWEDDTLEQDIFTGEEEQRPQPRNRQERNSDILPSGTARQHPATAAANTRPRNPRKSSAQSLADDESEEEQWPDSRRSHLQPQRNASSVADKTGESSRRLTGVKRSPATQARSSTMAGGMRQGGSRATVEAAGAWMDEPQQDDFSDASDDALDLPTRQQAPYHYDGETLGSLHRRTSHRVGGGSVPARAPTPPLPSRQA